METKTCTVCKRILPITDFGKCTKAKSGIMGRCKECTRKATREYQAKNREAVLQRKKKYREENKDKIAQYFKNFFTENPDKMAEYKRRYRDKDPERDKTYYTKYRQREEVREAIKVNKEKRRALQSQTIASLTPEQWEIIKAYFNNKCAYCGKEKDLHQEHFVPVAQKGDYTHNNIIPACRSCNSSKRDKDFFAWYPKQKFYSKKREAKILKFLGYTEQGKQQPTLII